MSRASAFGGGLAGFEGRRPTLSGGERRRLAIARRSQQPRVYVLDEPIQQLDPPHQLEVLPVPRARGRWRLHRQRSAIWHRGLADESLLFGDGRWQRPDGRCWRGTIGTVSPLRTALGRRSYVRAGLARRAAQPPGVGHHTLVCPAVKPFVAARSGHRQRAGHVGEAAPAASVTRRRHRDRRPIQPRRSAGRQQVCSRQPRMRLSRRPGGERRHGPVATDFRRGAAPSSATSLTRIGASFSQPRSRFRRTPARRTRKLMTRRPPAGRDASTRSSLRISGTRTKALVPSIGSTIQTYSASRSLLPVSSP